MTVSNKTKSSFNLMTIPVHFRLLLIILFVVLFGTFTYNLLKSSQAINANIDGQGVVDSADLAILLSNYGRNNKTFSQGDITEDGRVDGFDASALLSVWGYPSVVGNICANSATGNKINTIVVIAEENRRWGDASSTQFINYGYGFTGGKMPYLNAIANKCGYFKNDTEVDITDESAQQYVGAWTGYNHNVTNVIDNCPPSPTCSFTGNNIFRAMRAAGVPHHHYVEDMDGNCTNKHIPGTYGGIGGGRDLPYAILPTMYMTSVLDTPYCKSEQVPLSNFSFSNPAPGFSFITPNLCNSGHDCDDTTVDQWLANSSRLPALFNSSAYKSGKVLVELWWDEDAPKPNLFACWSCKKFVSNTDPRFAGESLLWLNLLGIPKTNLGQITIAEDIRPIIGTP